MNKGRFEITTILKNKLSVNDKYSYRKINTLRGGPVVVQTDPFVFFEEVWFDKGGGFPTHPHRGQATVSFVLEGSVKHRDSNGGEGCLLEGDVQLMEAASGITHSEMTDERCHLLQLWLNLPSNVKRQAPCYADAREADAPVEWLGGGRGHARVYAGNVNGHVGPLLSRKPFGMVDVKLPANTSYAFDVPSTNNVFFYLCEGGRVSFADAEPVSGAFSGVLTSSSPHPTSVVSLAAKEDARLLIYFGEPIKEPVVMKGLFVMNTFEEIEQAFRDFPFNN